MTLCKDCRHYEAPYKAPHVCNALNGRDHPVTGNPISGSSPDFMRATLCGWNDPRLFEPIPTSAPQSKFENSHPPI